MSHDESLKRTLDDRRNERLEAHDSLAASACSVERTSRDVIEHKLLTALEDGGVAAILSQQDLEDLVFACKLWQMRDARATRLGNLRRGMEQLLSEAFLPNADGLGRRALDSE